MKNDFQFARYRGSTTQFRACVYIFDPMEMSQTINYCQINCSGHFINELSNALFPISKPCWSIKSESQIPNNSNAGHTIDTSITVVATPEMLFK